MGEYGFWRPLYDPRLGLTTAISQKLHEMDLANPRLLPDLRGGSTILIASDYGGEHGGAKYQTLSFVIANPEHCAAWNDARAKLRREHLPEGRTMAFKALGDRVKWRALEPFLTAADQLDGLCVTFAIDTSVTTFFDGEIPVNLNRPELARYERWEKQVLEKLARVAHVISLFLSGMSRPGQNVVWVSDNDAIAANQQYAEEAGEFLNYLAHEYVEHPLGRLEFAVAAAVAKQDRQLAEDLLAIPDLVAGATAEYMATRGTRDRDRIVTPTRARILAPIPFCRMFKPQDRFAMEGMDAEGTWTHIGDISVKSAVIVRWLAASNRKLKRLIWAIASGPEPGQCLMASINLARGEARAGVAVPRLPSRSGKGRIVDGYRLWTASRLPQLLREPLPVRLLR